VLKEQSLGGVSTGQDRQRRERERQTERARKRERDRERGRDGGEGSQSIIFPILDQIDSAIGSSTKKSHIFIKFL
jgi:hypothetical protein